MQLRLASINQSARADAMKLLPKMDSKPARVQLLCTALQESGLNHRCQVLDGGGRGPARGYLMFEKGGVRGVLNHPKTAQPLYGLCESRGVAFDVAAIWTRIETDDILAFGLGRLLLWTDQKPLPPTDDSEGGWALYLRTWRPGRPRPDSWPAFHALARTEVLS
jgi:hypothetical protein